MVTEPASSPGTAPSADDARRVAERAHDSETLDRLASAGLLAFGLVHVVMGWLAVQLAFGDREGSSSTTGAVQQLAQGPLGVGLVWAVAVGMFLLVAWRALETFVGHRDEEGKAKRLGKRLVSAGKAVVYAAIGVSAVQVAVGAGGGGGSTDGMTARLMDQPAGPLIVGLVALVVAGIGVGLVVVAVREPYLKNVDRSALGGVTGRLFRWLARAGHTAKGVALLAIGALFGYAALTHDPSKSAGLDQALRTLLDEPLGPVAVAAVGVGLAGYGLYCFAYARRLQR